MPPPPDLGAVQLPALRSRFESHRWLAVTGVGAAAVVLAAVALPSTLPAGVAVGRLSGVLVPVAVGMLRLSRRHDDRFAMLLVGAGGLWSLTLLAESSASLPYSVGRQAVWLVEPTIVVLLLAFPWGVIPTRGERRLAVSIGLVALLLYVPSALFAPFPEPSPWTTCSSVSGCPADAFLLTDQHAALVDDVVRPVREVLSVVLFAGVALALVLRMARTRRHMRIPLAPVAAVAVVRALALAVYFLVRRSGHSSPAADALGWAFVLSLPVVTVAFGAGIVLVQLYTAEVLARLAGSLAVRPSARELRASLAVALRDPELAIAFQDRDGTWVDADGVRVEDPAEAVPPRRAITEVGQPGRPQAVVVHDAEVTENPALVAGISAYAEAALTNDRLVVRLEESLQDLALSRARLLTVADEERRRIERDLHDGAQQRLVALQIKLELLAERLSDKSPADAGEVRALERDIEATLEEVRRFGRGVYPPLLADRGIEDALLAVARPAAIPTTVDVQLARRYPRDVESAVYFCCLEALQNAYKHARGATRVTIAIGGSGDELRLEVSDDGSGFDPAAVEEGAGLTNVRDRLEALEGVLEITSRPGGGTRLTGVLPVDRDQVRSAAVRAQPRRHRPR